MYVICLITMKRANIMLMQNVMQLYHDDDCVKLLLIINDLMVWSKKWQLNISHTN